MAKSRRILSLLVWTMAFGAAGMGVRYWTQFQVETRYLVLLFIVLAILLEFAIRPALGLRRDMVGLVLNCAVASAAIIAMKWMLEGLPGWLY